MSDEQPTNPQQPDTILRSVTNVVQRTEAALSPWVRRWWQSGAQSAAPSVIPPAATATAAGSSGRSLPMTLRVQRTPAALVDRFSQSIVQRHAQTERISRRYRREEAPPATPRPPSAATLPLPGVGGAGETVPRVPGEMSLDELAASFQTAPGMTGRGEPAVQRAIDPALGAMTPAPERFAEIQDAVRRAAQRRISSSNAPVAPPSSTPSAASTGTPPPVQRAPAEEEASAPGGPSRSIAAEIEARIRAARAQRQAASGAGTTPAVPSAASAPSPQAQPAQPTSSPPSPQPGGAGRADVQRTPDERPLAAQPPAAQPQTGAQAEPPAPVQPSPMPESVPATVQRVSGSGDERVQVPEALSETPTTNPEDTGYSRAAALAERIRQARIQRTENPPESPPPRPTLRTSTDPDNPRFSKTASIAERIQAARERRAQGEAPVQRQVSPQPGDPRYSRAAEIRERLEAQRAQRRAQGAGQPPSPPSTSAPEQAPSQTRVPLDPAPTQVSSETVQRTPADQPDAEADAGTDEGEPEQGSVEPSADAPNYSIARAIEARLQAARAQRAAGRGAAAGAESADAPSRPQSPSVQRSAQPDSPQSPGQDVSASRADAIRRRMEAMRAHQAGRTLDTPPTAADPGQGGEGPAPVQRQAEDAPPRTPSEPGAAPSAPAASSAAAEDVTPVTRPTIARDFKPVGNVPGPARPRAFSRSQVLTPERKTGDFSAGDPKAGASAPGSVQRTPAVPPLRDQSAAPQDAPATTSEPSAPEPSAPAPIESMPRAADAVQRTPELGETPFDASDPADVTDGAGDEQPTVPTGGEMRSAAEPTVQRSMEAPAVDDMTRQDGSGQEQEDGAHQAPSTDAMSSSGTPAPVQRVSAERAAASEPPASASTTSEPTTSAPAVPAPAEAASKTRPPASDVQRAPSAPANPPVDESTAGPVTSSATQEPTRDAPVDAPTVGTAPDATHSSATGPIQRQVEEASASTQPAEMGTDTAASGAPSASPSTVPPKRAESPPTDSTQAQPTTFESSSPASSESAAAPSVQRTPDMTSPAHEDAQAAASSAPTATERAGGVEETVPRQAETPDIPETAADSDAVSDAPTSVQRGIETETRASDTAAATPPAASSAPTETRRTEVDTPSTSKTSAVQRQPDSRTGSAGEPPAHAASTGESSAEGSSGAPSARPVAPVQRAPDETDEAVDPSSEQGTSQPVQREADAADASSVAPSTPSATPPVQRQAAPDESESSAPAAPSAPTPEPGGHDQASTATEPSDLTGASRAEGVQRQLAAEQSALEQSVVTEPTQPADGIQRQADEVTSQPDATQPPQPVSSQASSQSLSEALSEPSSQAPSPEQSPRSQSSQEQPPQQQPPSIQRSTQDAPAPVEETDTSGEGSAASIRRTADAPEADGLREGGAQAATSPASASREPTPTQAPPATQAQTLQRQTDLPDARVQDAPQATGKTPGSRQATEASTAAADLGEAGDAPGIQRQVMSGASATYSPLPLIQRRPLGPILSRTVSPTVLSQTQPQTGAGAPVMAAAAVAQAPTGVQRAVDAAQTAPMGVPPVTRATVPRSPSRATTQKSMPLVAPRKTRAKTDEVQRKPVKEAVQGPRTSASAAQQTQRQGSTASLPVQRSPQNLIQRARVTEQDDAQEDDERVVDDAPSTTAGVTTTAEETNELSGTDLDTLARALLPVIKRMLVIERERRPVR